MGLWVLPITNVLKDLVGQLLLLGQQIAKGKEYQFLIFLSSINQHNRFVLDCKDKEPDVLFVGDSMVQLMQQYEVNRVILTPCICPLITYRLRF